MLNNVLQSYRQAGRLILPNVTVHVFFVLVSAGILVPIVAALARVTLSFSNQTALTDQDIALFLLTPAGFIGGLIVVALAIAVIILDVAVMTAVLRAGIEKPAEALRIAMSFTLRSVVPLAFFAGRLLLRILVIVIPFVIVAGAAALWLLSDYDINYYLSTRPPEFIATAGIIAVSLLAMVVLLLRRLLPWSVAMHFVLFDGTPPGEAFAISSDYAGTRKRAILGKILFWLAIRLALGAVLTALVATLVAFLLNAFAGSLTGIATALSVVFAIYFLVSLLLSALGNGALADLLNREFEAALAGRTPREDASTIETGGILGTAAIAIPAALAIAAAVSLVSGAWFLERIGPDSAVEVIGHRGAAASRPENTMAAVEKAIEDGADWVEIDVQESADGQVVVAHDSDFMKSAGVDLKVWDATAEDLADIDIGSWFDPEYANERTPLLADVLEAANGRAGVIIELKYYGHDVDLENRVAMLVEAAGMEDQIATMSLKYPAVQKMIALRPEWRTGVLAATSVGDLSGLEGDFLAVNSAQVSRGLLSRAHDADKDVYAWTVNDPMTMSRMISMGIDGLITDEPALARRVIEARQDMTTPQRLMLALADRFQIAIDPPSPEDTLP